MRDHAPAFERVVACLYDEANEAAYRDAAAALGVVLDAAPAGAPGAPPDGGRP
jgi:hypothetical protein